MTDPSWTDIAGAIAGLLAVLLALLAGIVAYAQLNEMKLTRLTGLMTDLSRRWDEPTLKESRDALTTYSVEGLKELVQSVYTETADQAIRQRYFVLEALPNFLESIAIMERRGLSIELIDEHWGSAIATTWRDWEPSVAFLRARLRTDTIYANLENLAKKIERRRGIPPAPTATGPTKPPPLASSTV